jgi:hypothetical protein
MAGIVPAAEGDHPGMTADNDLVVRTWRATATSAGAREYHSYFAGTLLPGCVTCPDSLADTCYHAT